MQRLARFLGAPCALVLALTLAAGPVLADTPGSGYTLSTTANPAFASVTCTLPGGDVVTFDGLSVDRWTAGGAFVQNLATFPGFVFPSFVRPTPDGAAVVTGENSNGGLHRVALDGSGASFLVTLVFNYDAAFESSGDLIVSAATGGFGAGNDLVRVDMSPPSATSIGHVAGVSGPVEIQHNGDLYYGLQDFPQPAGTASVILWTAAQVASGTPLSEANATVFGTGLDGTASMRFDPVSKKLYLAEVNSSTGANRVLRAGPTRALSQLVARGPAGRFISNLEFVSSGGGAASFGAYQPSNGSNLKYNTTDFVSRSDQTLVRPQRPTLTASGDGTTGQGAVTLSVSGAVPNGSVYLALCPQIAIAPVESAYAFPGFLYHTDFTLSLIRRTTFLVPADASGQASLQIWNPGDLQGQLGYQFFVGGADGVFAGSSNSVRF